jgi:ApbE superfamily uncharacterized protein (UPF0280 family)
MFEAVVPHAGYEPVTPMAAVAGSVADEIGAAMTAEARLDRWMVNNGGDIALGLAAGHQYRAGMVVHPRRGTINSTALIRAGAGIGGIATSGRGGRSFSLGIADAVTVLAPTAAAADAAATLIANHVSLGPHPEVTREPADTLDPDTDLGNRLVTVDVGPLTSVEINRALASGLEYAESCVDRGLIGAAILNLAGCAVGTATSLLSSGDHAVMSPIQRNSSL